MSIEISEKHLTNNEGRYNMGIKITTAVKTRPLDGINSKIGGTRHGSSTNGNTAEN